MSCRQSPRQTPLLAVAMALVSLMTCAANAADSLLIYYQGRLADDSGEPLDTTVAMTFGIYASPSDPSGLWSETHAGVTVSQGLFSILLGSVTYLPDSIFTGADRYLGIRVGGDDEISPRTLLTSAPDAALARRIVGDIETGLNSLLIKNSTGDSTIVIDAGSGRDNPRMFFSAPPDPCIPGLEFSASSEENYISVGMSTPPDPYAPAVLMMNDQIGSKLQINWAAPPDPHREAIIMEVDNSGNLFQVNASWPPEPYSPAFEVFSDAASEAISMKMSAPPDPIMPDIEMTVQANAGASVNIYDDIGKVMGVEPVPFNEGYSLKMFDPGQPAETELMEIATSYGETSVSSVRMYSTDAADPSEPEIELVSQWDGNRMTVGLAVPPDLIKPGVELTSDATTGMVKVGGGSPAPAGQQMIVLMADQNTARLGIGTDAPTTALDVDGIAQMTGFKLPTDANDGYVLTSDATGTGTWQPASGQAAESCGGTETGLITGSGSYTIAFPVAFNGEPYFSVSAVILSGANAGKPCYVSDISFSGPGEPTINAATIDLQYHNGVAWQDVDGGVQVQVSYTAIEQ